VDVEALSARSSVPPRPGAPREILGVGDLAVLGAAGDDDAAGGLDERGVVGGLCAGCVRSAGRQNACGVCGDRRSVEGLDHGVAVDPAIVADGSPGTRRRRRRQQRR
jgi:hypothetical protein